MPDDGCDVVVLEGGALAMRDAATGEIMHPVVGPEREAEALYVAPSRLRERLRESIDGPLVVLDIGLGAGSNAVAALRAAAALPSPSRRLEVVSFDRTLAPLALALEPAHAAAFGFDAESSAAARALIAHHRHVGAGSRWQLRLGELSHALAQEPVASADVVFWDMWPSRNDPALWSVASFRSLRARCRAGATVHTYSAATTTRTALLLAGFFVGLGPPSGRKHRPTTIAATDVASLERPLPRQWLADLARARVPFTDDAPADALAAVAAHPQFHGS